MHSQQVAYEVHGRLQSTRMESIMPMSALQLCNELVLRSEARQKRLTNLEIQKLAYFCHGWYLALQGEPLVNDQGFEAWRLGPVLPDLYHTLKVFSSNPIPSSHPLLRRQERVPMDSPDSALIDRVLDIYGNFEGHQLVDMSHRPEGPWYRIWHDENASSGIPNGSIQAYFRQLAGQPNETS
ncbi:Panacea domain-containing protein [Paraburkholderia tropica]|nr:type II toxin-antitoxin system antitoxin SocA domain-containing protein [Paraburkholderia tropica]